MRSVLKILCTTALIFVLGFFAVTLRTDGSSRDQSYLMAVPDNYERLTNSKNVTQRIILLGGSSIGWGISAKTISEELNISAINLGVHAGIGYRNIWLLYQNHLVPKRDIIVVSPEYSMISAGAGLTKTYCDVLYLTQDSTWDALRCGARNLLTHIKGTVISRGSDNISLYQRAGFNSYGDYTLAYDLPNQGGFSAGETLDLNADTKEIIEYQGFLKGLTEAGYKVIFAPTTLATKSCRESPLGYYKLNKSLAAGLPIHFDEHFPYCAPDPMFVNTSYHTNLEGTMLKTNAVLRVVRANLGI